MGSCATVVLLLLCYTRVVLAAWPLKPCPKPGQEKAFSNGTARMGGCKPDCIRDNAYLDFNKWRAVPASKTITAETVVTIINNKKGTTRTTTITNEEEDLSEFTKPADTNEEGYRTHTIVDIDSAGTGSTTVTLTFPTAYIQYSETYLIKGQLSTTEDGKATCAQFTGDTVSNGGGAVRTLPSHPPLPQTVGNLDFERYKQDPKGWTFRPARGPPWADPNDPMEFSGLSEDLLPPLFPGLPLWQCTPACFYPAAPNDHSSIALFLTATSTSIEDDDGDDEPEPTEEPNTNVQALPITEPTKPADAGKPNDQPPAAPVNEPQKPGPEPTKPAEPVQNDEPPPAAEAPKPPEQPAKPAGEPAKPPGQPAGQEGGQPNGAGAANNNPPAQGGNNAPAQGGNNQPAQGGNNAPAQGGNNLPAQGGNNPPVQGGNNQPQPAQGDAGSLPPVIPPGNNGNGANQGGNQGGNQAAGQNQGNGAPLPVAPAPIEFAGQTFTPVVAQPAAGNAGRPQNGQPAGNAPQNQPVPPNSPVEPGAGAVPNQPPTPNAPQAYVVAGQTLNPGSSLTVPDVGPVVYQTSNGNAILQVGSSTTTLPLPAPTGPAPLTFNSQTFTPNAAGAYVIASQTLKPGNQITVSGTPISLAAAGNSVVIGSSTQPLTLTPAPAAAPLPLTFGTETITPNPQGAYVVAGQTLTPGSSPVTISGTPISLAPGGSSVVIGSSTQTLLSPSTATAQAAAGPITIGAETATPNAQGAYVVAGQTLTPGGSITVSGTAVSLASDGATAVVGSTTQTLKGGEAGPTGVGDAIMQGFGPGGSGSGEAAQPFEGAATEKQRGLGVTMMVAILGVGVAMGML